MIVRLILIFLFTLLEGICFGKSTGLTPAEETILRVLGTGRVKADLTLIPPDQKDAVIRRLREIATLKQGSVEIGDTLVHVMAADLLLLRLGDKFTMERMVQDYRAYNSTASWSYDQSQFEYSRQPLLIPYLAEDFYLEEDPTKGITVRPPPGSAEFGVSVPSRSVFSGVTVVRIVEEAPEFTQEMKAWAKQASALRRESSVRFRNLMRVFWEKNKAAFGRGDYHAVVPVTENEAAPPPAVPAPLATPAPLPLSQTPRSTTPAVQLTLSSEPAKTPRWIWAVVAVAVLALATVALKWKRQ